MGLSSLADAPAAEGLPACDHPLVERIYRERRIPREDGSSIDLNIYIPKEEGDFLYGLVRRLRPETTVEVGMANGLSTLFITAALEAEGQGRHIAIDPYQTTEWQSTALGLLRQAHLAHRVELVERPSHMALPELERAGIRSQFLFVDGSHLFDYVMADFVAADRILDVGGLLVLDDSDWPAVRAAIRYILLNRHYSVAHPEVVIEPPPGRTRLPGRFLRGLAKGNRRLAGLLRHDFVVPDRELKVMGRCVALRKEAEDDRNSQDEKLHNRF